MSAPKVQSHASRATYTMLCLREFAQALHKLPLDGHSAHCAVLLMVAEVERLGELLKKSKRITGPAVIEMCDVGFCAERIRQFAEPLNSEEYDDGLCNHPHVEALGYQIAKYSVKISIAADRAGIAIDDEYFPYFETPSEAKANLGDSASAAKALAEAMSLLPTIHAENATADV